jgi:hypothetical protein
MTLDLSRGYFMGLFSGCLRIPNVFWLQSDGLIKTLGVNNSGVIKKMVFINAWLSPHGAPSQPHGAKCLATLVRAVRTHNKD